MSEFVEDNEFHAGYMLGKPALSPVAGLGRAIDEVDPVVEAAMGAGSDVSRDSDGQMGLTGARSADTTLRCWAMKPTPARSIDVPSNWNWAMSLASGRYLIE